MPSENWPATNPFEYHNPKVLFKGKRVSAFSIEAPHPKGGVMTREVIDHPGAVVILPFLDPKTILLINNNRPVVQETLLELPAGTLEPNEEPATTAKRELQEETGYVCKELCPLFWAFSTPGFCNERLFFFAAHHLTPTKQNLDDTEEITVIPTPLKDALTLIKTGQLTDAKTIAALLYQSDALKAPRFSHGDESATQLN